MDSQGFAKVRKNPTKIHTIREDSHKKTPFAEIRKTKKYPQRFAKVRKNPQNSSNIRKNSQKFAKTRKIN